MAEARFVLVDVAVLVEEHVAARATRCLFAVIDRDRFARLGIVNQHEPAAAEVARARQRHRKRKAHRDRSVDGITAVGQYLRADFRRVRILRRDHAVGAEDGVPKVAITNDRLVAGLSENERQRQQESCNKPGQFQHGRSKLRRLSSLPIRTQRFPPDNPAQGSTALKI